MKNFVAILIYFTIILKAMLNPLKLYSCSLQRIKNLLDNNAVNIISRIYPNFFDDQTTPEYSGLFDLFYNNEIPEEEIDLSNMEIKRIPISLVSKMTNVKKLDLSNNHNINLNESWFSFLFDNLKELSLKNCSLSNEDLKAIANMKLLERLNLSGNIGIDLRILKPILANLIHIDVSNSYLEFSDLKYILNCADKLESLNFSGNDLSDQTTLSTILSEKPNLKILKLSKCKLGFEVLKNIIDIHSLEELDFSKNYLNFFEQKTTKYMLNLFNIQGNLNIKDAIYTHFKTSAENIVIESKQKRTSKSRLKVINLEDCYLENECFIKKLFDIEGLEILNLRGCILDFDIEKILNGKAKDSLKELIISFCSINLSTETFKCLTDFKKLEKLDITGNRLADLPDDFSFGQSKYSLKKLNICAIEVNKAMFRSLTECTCLERLDLSMINFQNITLADMNLGFLKNTLKELNLQLSNLNLDWLTLFTDCPNLEKLNCFGNNFSSRSMKYSLGCAKESLKVINLGASQLTYEILSEITDCPKLTILNVSNNNFKEIPSNFKFGRSKQSLKELYIDNTNLNSNGLLSISECKKLEKLWIHGNDFSNLPDSFSFKLLEHSLKELRIFNSNINYFCLNAISKCRNLEILKLGIIDFPNSEDHKVRNIIEKLRKSVREFCL